MRGRGCQGKVKRHYEGEGEQRGSYCLSFSQKAPQYLPHNHPYLLSITHYYSLLSPFALFSLIGKLFICLSDLSVQLHSSGRSFPALCYLHLSFCPTPFLYHSSSLHVLSLRQKPCVILSTLLPSFFSLSLSLSQHSLSPFPPCSPVDETRRLCVPYTDLGRHLFHPLSPSYSFHSVSTHTHTRRHTCTVGDEGKAWSKMLQWII